MKVIKTANTNLNYLGPREDIGDLPCERRDVDGGTAIFSTWEFSDWERKAISEGQNIEVGIWFIEPIPPISVGITPAKEFNEIEKSNGKKK